MTLAVGKIQNAKLKYGDVKKGQGHDYLHLQKKYKKVEIKYVHLIFKFTF